MFFVRQALCSNNKKNTKRTVTGGYEKDWLIYCHGNVLYNQIIEALMVKFKSSFPAHTERHNLGSPETQFQITQTIQIMPD